MDEYDRKARLYPVAMVLLPATILAILLFTLPHWSSGVAALLVASGLHVPVLFLVRDLGARAQVNLWRLWGGAPTTLLLRSGGSDNYVLHEQRLSNIERATGISLPRADVARENPRSADEAYEAATAILRNQTRDSSKFPLVFNELKNYGYRRNLYGCKPVGLAISFVALAIEVALIIAASRGVSEISMEAMLVGAGVSCLWIGIWTYWVTPSFVRQDADRYARALIDSASSVDNPPQLSG